MGIQAIQLVAAGAGLAPCLFIPPCLAVGKRVCYYPRMNFDTVLQPGLRGEKTATVTEQNTARSLGSGGLAVFATPSLVALLEGACVQAVDGLLPEGYSTVGTDVRVKHLAATPVGMSVRAEGELTEVDGRRLTFQVAAFDEAGKIGEGAHERFIVDNGRFLAKAEAKRTEAAAPVCGDR